MTRHTFTIPIVEVRAMQRLLDAHRPSESGYDYVKVYRANLGDGYTAHINILNEEEGPVIDAALFLDGNEVDSLGNEHRYKLIGDYGFEHGGRRFVVSVRAVERGKLLPMFGHRFNRAMSKPKAWVDAPPSTCAQCGRPYDEHLEPDEKCPIDDPNAYYVDPEAWA